VGRRAWQGLLGLWRTARGSTVAVEVAESPVPIEVSGPSDPSGGWTHLEMAGGGLGDGADETAEELAAFLAADHEPVEADPEFKRKLRDQLWTLVQGNEMTRQ
jgi:hypothetical protein